VKIIQPQMKPKSKIPSIPIEGSMKAQSAGKIGSKAGAPAAKAANSLPLASFGVRTVSATGG
jgi:hypothetical protein